MIHIFFLACVFIMDWHSTLYFSTSFSVCDHHHDVFFLLRAKIEMQTARHIDTHIHIHTQACVLNWIVTRNVRHHKKTSLQLVYRITAIVQPHYILAMAFIFYAQNIFWFCRMATRNYKKYAYIVPFFFHFFYECMYVYIYEFERFWYMRRKKNWYTEK